MNVGIVGGGNGGASILRTLNKMPDTEVIGIIDLNEYAPGILLAKELNIPHSSNIKDLFQKKVDIIIEATGVQKVQDQLNILSDGNVSIMCSKAANLMMRMVDNEEELLNKIENQIKEVEKVSIIASDNIDKMKTSIASTSNVNQTLNKFASKTIALVKETDKIINIMSQITQQTNILGLNASIEAARAGEQGRGFSIVANEVRKLANNSEDFTAQISSILKNITNEVVNVSKEIEELNTVTSEQKEVGNNLEAAISSLLSNVHKL